jgi:CHAD domain-containing protein
MPERELKLSAPFELRLPNVWVGGRTVVAGSWRYLDAVYYDTADLRLARWGCSLRHRTDEGWAVTLPAAGPEEIQERREIRFQGRWNQIPAAAQSLARGYARRAVLQQIARLRTARKPWLVVDGSGRPVAEIVDDDVSTYRGVGPAGRFREIGIELADGADPRILEELVSGFRAAGAGPVARSSKLARALGRAALEDADVVVAEPGDDAGVGEIVKAAFARSVHRFIVHMPGVQLGENPEALHQARVATRRLRSDLRTFSPLMDEQWVSGLRDELRWMGSSLGPVRDVDVLTLRLSTTAEQLPEAGGYPLHVIMRMLAAQRKARRKALLETIAQDRYLDLLDRMVEAANAPRLLSAPKSAAPEVLRELVRGPYELLTQTIMELPEAPADADLHRIRIRAKRVRYATEAIASMVGKKAVRFAAAASVLQDTLGELQDAAVAHDWLDQTARDHPAVAFTAGQLAGFELVRADAARTGWGKPWGRLSSEKLRGWM